MSVLSTFYQEQADRCGKEASVTDLPQLREKQLRSQTAWQALADRLSLSEDMRAKREAANAADNDIVGLS